MSDAGRSELSATFERQKLLLLRGTLGIVSALAVGLALVGWSLQRNAELSHRIVAALDSANTAAATSRATAVRSDSIRDEMKAGIDSILRDVGRRSVSNRQFQREQLNTLRTELRREFRAVGAAVDSVQDVLPAPKRSRR